MRHLRTVLKPFGGVTVVFVVLGSSLILLNPLQTKFLFIKNLLKTGFVIETKYLRIVHGTVVNGVQGRMSLFITLKPEVMMFISRAHV